MTDRQSPHVLYVIGQLARGGAEQQLSYLLEHLKPRATVVSLSPGGHLAERIRGLGYEVVELRRVGHREIGRLRRVHRLIRERRPDIVHLFTDSASGVYGRAAALLAGHRHVIVGERRHPSRDPRWLAFLKRVVLNRRVDFVVTNAEASRAYLLAARRVPPDRVRVIPNGIEVERFTAVRDRSPLPEDWRDEPVVGMVGSLRPVKAPEVFVRAAARLLADGVEARFVHVGGGDLLEPMRALSADLGIEGRVRFVGPSTTVPEWLRSFDVFVLTSNTEGMSNAIMEAMATGLPCVVSDAGDNRRLVEDGASGYVVPTGDPEALAARLRRLIEDAALRRAMGEASRERIRRYDVRRMAASYGALYREALGWPPEGAG